MTSTDEIHAEEGKGPMATGSVFKPHGGIVGICSTPHSTTEGQWITAGNSQHYITDEETFILRNESKPLASSVCKSGISLGSLQMNTGLQ